MGSVQVKYNQSRGSHDAGSDITDPQEFFQAVFETDYERYQSQYNGLSAKKKAELNKIFGGVAVMENSAMAGFWKTENSSEAALRAAMEKVRAFRA